jgi:hypothetical protein
MLSRNVVIEGSPTRKIPGKVSPGLIQTGIAVFLIKADSPGNWDIDGSIDFHNPGKVRTIP